MNKRVNNVNNENDDSVTAFVSLSSSLCLLSLAFLISTDLCFVCKSFDTGSYYSIDQQSNRHLQCRSPDPDDLMSFCFVCKSFGTGSYYSIDLQSNRRLQCRSPGPVHLVTFFPGLTEFPQGRTRLVGGLE